MYAVRRWHNMSSRACSRVATTDSTPSALTALFASMRWMLTSATLTSLVLLTSQARINGRMISCVHRVWGRA